MRRYNGHCQAVFNNVCHGSKARLKIAVIAVARRLLIYYWMMLRDGSEWRDLYDPRNTFGYDLTKPGGRVGV